MTFEIFLEVHLYFLSPLDRILKRILKDHLSVILVKVKVAKINPPIGGNVDEVAVERELNRSSIDFG